MCVLYTFSHGLTVRNMDPQAFLQWFYFVVSVPQSRTSRSLLQIHDDMCCILYKKFSEGGRVEVSVDVSEASGTECYFLDRRRRRSVAWTEPLRSHNGIPNFHPATIFLVVPCFRFGLTNAAYQAFAVIAPTPPCLHFCVKIQRHRSFDIRCFLSSLGQSSGMGLLLEQNGPLRSNELGVDSSFQLNVA